MMEIQPSLSRKALLKEKEKKASSFSGDAAFYTQAGGLPACTCSLLTGRPPDLTRQGRGFFLPVCMCVISGGGRVGSGEAG